MMETGTLISLAIYFALMLCIGIYAYRQSTADMSEYMLGGRRLGPAVTSLSAGASDMSGWLLLGVPGAAYVSGLPAGWIAIGLTAGAFANYLLVAPRLRVYTELADDALTIPDFFEKRFADRTRALRLLSSVVIVLFFTLYTSAGVVAGGKLFDSAFGAAYETGLWITIAVVVAYTFAGGFMAVSLTDFVQGTIMFIALVLVPVVAFTQLGDSAPFDPTRLNMVSGASMLGVISSMAWGLGYFGQPHIIVRFMAIRSVKDIPTARRIGISWMVVTLLGAMATGLVGFAYAAQNKLALQDPETIFIVLSQVLFNDYVSGFLLAAILAAIMSTISSQLLVASSSLTEDFYRLFVRRSASQRELVGVGRLCVVVVALVAVLLAYNPESNVLSLVSNAWAGFGAAFGPVIILSLHWRRMTMAGALAGMAAGAITVLVWSYVPLLPPAQPGGAAQPLDSVLYSIVPGFIISLIAVYGVSVLGRARADLASQFDNVASAMKHT